MRNDRTNDPGPAHSGPRTAFSGNGAPCRGPSAAGRPLGEQAVGLARTTADAFCLTIALASYGVVLLALEEYDNARAALEESAARGRETGDAWAVALPLRNLAIIAHRQRDYRTARRLLEESLHGLRGLGEKWFLSRSIETLAEVMASAGEHERAAHLFGAAETLREAVGASVLAFYRADYDRAIDTVTCGPRTPGVRVVLDRGPHAGAGGGGRVRARRIGPIDASATLRHILRRPLVMLPFSCPLGDRFCYISTAHPFLQSPHGDPVVPAGPRRNVVWARETVTLAPPSTASDSTRARHQSKGR